jgi:hypothetical protein
MRMNPPLVSADLAHRRADHTKGAPLGLVADAFLIQRQQLASAQDEASTHDDVAHVRGMCGVDRACGQVVAREPVGRAGVEQDQVGRAAGR